MSRTLGDQVSRVLEEACRSHGSGVARALSEIYQEHGRELGDLVANGLERHGERFVMDLSRLVREDDALRGALENLHRLGGSAVLNGMFEGMPYVERLSRSALPQGQKSQAFSALLTALTYVAESGGFRRATRRLAVDGLRYLASQAQVQCDNGQTVSLDEYARSWIRNNAPFLAGSSVERDPVGAVTYVLVFNDTDYIANEMRIIPGRDGQFRTPREALYSAAPKDVGQVLGVLDAMGSAERLRREALSGGDIDGAALALANSLGSLGADARAM
jgi:hypothetical protein